MSELKPFEKTVASFKRKAMWNDGHEPTLTLVETHSGWLRRHEFMMECECGWTPKGYNDTQAHHHTGTNGDVLTNEYRLFSRHAAPPGKLDGSSEPILMAKIHKQRVTNEVWLFNEDHDLPGGTKEQWYPWGIWVKNSTGWRQRGGGHQLEAARSRATAFIEKLEGLHKIEWMTRESVGVEAPVATIISAASKLVAEAKDLKNPAALRDHLKLVHEGVTQLNILKQLEGELEERLHAFMDLGI